LLFVLQLAPAVQALQTALLLHTPATPAAVEQRVPTARAVASAQVCPGGPHCTTPAWHSESGFEEHEVPAVQGTHAPLTHTPPEHVAPSATAVTAPHSPPPAPQLKMPWVHSVGWHTAPGWQATHAPVVSQTPPSQAVPGALGPMLKQADAPELHEVMPNQHSWGNAQTTPGRQETQPPAPSHTWSTPQDKPGADGVPRSMQRGPWAQLWRPSLHGAPGGAHPASSTHEVQFPATQTKPPSAHGVPLFMASVVSTQDSLPEAHEINPMWQGFNVLHEPPWLQAMQAPPLHTPPSSQPAPLGRLMD